MDEVTAAEGPRFPAARSSRFLTRVNTADVPSLSRSGRWSAPAERVDTSGCVDALKTGVPLRAVMREAGRIETGI
jgi:hypothetical protein